jgi:hypothetical protein
MIEEAIRHLPGGLFFWRILVQSVYEKTRPTRWLSSLRISDRLSPSCFDYSETNVSLIGPPSLF